MSSRAITVSCGLLVPFTTFLVGVACAAAAAADVRVSESYGKMPLHFEANQGQSHKDVRFLARGPGYSLYLTADEAVLVLTRPAPAEERDEHGEQAPRESQPVALRMSLVGAARKPLVSGLEELPGKANYLVGNDPAKWRTNVPTYARVHYREVYPGIDLVYYGNQRQLEYDFVVAPGADPKNIVLGFKGADKLEIDAEGELVLHTAGGAVRQHKPVIYQEIDGVREEIAGGYVRKGANRVGFKVAAYDRTRPLVIDPVLAYSTFLGGRYYDFGKGIAVDAAGNAYVMGDTSSTDFPTMEPFQPAFGGGTSEMGDTFVTKLNPTGSALIYSTYLGGGSQEATQGIAVDAAGNVYVTGITASSNFPTTPGAFQLALAGGFDAFVTKLNPNGSALIYSTYLGGNGDDLAGGIAVDASGNAYLAGETVSHNFPTTPGAFQTTKFPDGHVEDAVVDAFVTKLNPTGSALVYSTYLGGSHNDSLARIAVDTSGNAYVTGRTTSRDFPVTVGAFQPAYGGGFGDTFVTKLDPTGSALVYSTYLGGSGEENDFPGAIAVDTNGNAYVTGSTQLSNFPTTTGAFQSLFGGIVDAFVTKLDPTGSALVYSTYLGGGSVDRGSAIAVDAAGNAYVTGYTASTNFPTAGGPFQPALSNSSHSDAFVAKLNPTGGLVYSTYLGGYHAEWGKGIAVDPDGNAYVTGHTWSNDFPTTAGSFQAEYGGEINDSPRSDGFVVKIVDTPSPPPTPYSGTPFSGTPIAIPGSFEAEDFDLGGEGVAYHDNTPGNQGGAYRTEDVDIIVSADSAGGNYVVNNFATKEWLAYTINVATSGFYNIEIRASSAMSNSGFHIAIDGENVTGPIVVPNTGSWSTFQWVGRRFVSLTAGQHVLKIVTDQQYFDLDSVRVLPSTSHSEESAATYSGWWPTYGSEQGTFSGGTMVAANAAGSTATFHFTGTAITWIGVKCNICGIATVSIDGGVPSTVNTIGPRAPGNLSSEPVFSASGLAPGVTHTMTITVTGTTSSLLNLSSGGAFVAVDAFDVTR